MGLIEHSKEERIELARQFIKKLTDEEEKIQSDSIRNEVGKLIEQIREVRDLQYLFDSGERQIIQLYERYLPHAVDIVKQYIQLESSANYEAVRKARSQLVHTFDLLIQAMGEIKKILPQDEIEESKATQFAFNMKQQLNQSKE